MGLKIFITVHVWALKWVCAHLLGVCVLTLNGLGVRTQLVRLVQPVLLPTELSC